MKVLVVAGGGAIFQRLAQELAAEIGDSHTVVLAREDQAASLGAVLKQRVRRSGLLKAIDQLAFKAFDMWVLRRRREAQARERLDPKLPLSTLPALNSAEGMSELRRGDYDLVVGIATSIISPAALAIPRHGFINIHPGVLPEYRGTGNLWAVVNRDWQRIGCTVHWMTERIDVGRIIAIEYLHNWPPDLWGLHEAAMRAGCRALAACLRSGALLHTSIDVSDRRSGYFGWYGFIDYLRFKWAIARRKP